MAGQRQPIGTIKAKGKKHLTKAEIAERERTEVHAPADKVTPPKYLSKGQKSKFRRIVKALREIDLISNLDVDALARFIIAQEEYEAITAQIAETPIMMNAFVVVTGAEGNESVEEKLVVNPQYEKLIALQDKLFKQCRQGAADFGLTVSSRCRLIVPKAQEAPKENKFSKFEQED